MTKIQPRCKYVFTPHEKFNFSIFLCEGLGYCTLCKFLGRPRSNYDYIHCPVCAKEREEYAHNQILQDFLFDDAPEIHRAYSTDLHGKVRIIEALFADGQISEEEATAHFTDLAVSLQPKLRHAQEETRESWRQNPSEELKRVQNYRFFS